MSHCDNCGCRVYSGACVNCHEATYIEQQYVDLEMTIPRSITEEADSNRVDIAKNKMIKESI